MFIFLMSARLRPYFASKSSSKIASSNVFEHSSPMLSDEATRDLARLALLHHRRHRALAAHAHQRDALGAALDRVVVRERVGRVRVAAPGRGDDVVAGAGHAGHRLPRRAVTLEVRHERGVDDVLVEAVQEDRRHQPAVLTDLVEHRVGRAGEDDVLVDARHLLGLTGAPEQELVDLGLPRPEPRARPGAARAALLAVTAVVGRVALLQVEGLVDALVVAVAQHVVRARDHAAGATGAETAGDDLLVQVTSTGTSRAASRQSVTAVRTQRQPHPRGRAISRGGSASRRGPCPGRWRAPSARRRSRRPPCCPPGGRARPAIRPRSTPTRSRRGRGC